MFIDEMFKSCKNENFLNYHKNNCTYQSYYFYWRNWLFERVMRLFVWEGLPEYLDQKEIEQRLHLNGHCAITTIPRDSELTAMFGDFYGVGKYYDERPNYTVRCPIYSGTRTIGKDCIVISNNALRNSTYALVHHYATLLAHNEVTFVDVLINARDSGGIPVGGTDKQIKSIKQYQADVFNGKYGVVTDIGNLGINYIGTDRHTTQSILDIFSTREKILKSFFSCIGVRSAFEKRSNSVEAEVEADTSLLLLNLSDMLNYRKKGCDAVNKLYGQNWSVRISDEINYNEENEMEMEEGGEDEENNTGNIQ